MAIAQVKTLVHPDGERFVLWHPKLDFYCPFECSSDNPPDPRTMCIDWGEGVQEFDVAELRWQLTGEAFDTVTGVTIWQKPPTKGEVL